MKHGPSNHHPKCTCRLCQPPVARPPAPPPRDPALFGERRPSTPVTRPAAPVAPAALTPPAPPVQYLPDVDDRDGAVRATIAAARRLEAARLRTAADNRLVRYLALRAAGVPREKAERQVDAEFERKTP